MASAPYATDRVVADLAAHIDDLMQVCGCGEEVNT